MKTPAWMPAPSEHGSWGTCSTLGPGAKIITTERVSVLKEEYAQAAGVLPTPDDGGQIAMVHVKPGP